MGGQGEPSEGTGMLMAIYRSKPTTVDAIQWTGENSPEVLQFAWWKLRPVYDGDIPLEFELLAGVDGAQGWVHVPVGHWIVCQPRDKSDMWPVANEFFSAKYESQEIRIVIDFHAPHHKYVHLGDQFIGHLWKKRGLWEASDTFGEIYGVGLSTVEAAQIVADNYRPGKE